MTSYYDEFPTLKSKELELNTKMKRIRSKIKDVKDNERFADNEAERDYQLNKLNDEMEEILAASEDDFQIELEVTRLHLAEQAFAPIEATPEELATAKETAQTICSQVTMTANPSDTLSLLSMRAKSLTDVEKQTLAQELPSIVETALSKATTDKQREELNGYIEAINEEVTNTAHARSIAEQQEALKKMETAGANTIRGKHDMLNLVVENVGKSGGGLV